MDDWKEVVLLLWSVEELLSSWERDLVLKCTKRLMSDIGLTRAQQEKLHEIYIERYIEKIQSSNRKEE